MQSEPLDIVPLWALLLIAASALWIVMEIGYRVGKWRHALLPDEREAPVGAMVTSILGLVALVLGFTFSLAATRFDARRMAVLEEANAIGTCYLRTRLLPQPEQAQSARLLREYVGERIRGISERKTDEAIRRSEALHEQLWAEATHAAEKNANPITAVFILSLNEVIDMHSKRLLVGIHSRIPLLMWVGLYGLSMLGMAAVGYQAALTTTRRSPAMIGLVLSFAIVLLLITDLDRGQEGMMQVSQQPMIDLQRSMQASP